MRIALIATCLGDALHPEVPKATVALLERLGWKFACIRASAFFRDPEAAMRPVREKLQALGIQRLGAAQSENEIREAGALGGTLEYERDQGASTSLVDKVVEQAASLRRQWQTKEEQLGLESLEREPVKAR